MTQLFRRFAIVFFAGFLGMVLALAYGGLAGNIFSSNPFLVSIRFLSAGLMVAGLTLWICLLRSEAGKPGLNMFLILVIAAGIAMLIVRLLFQNNLAIEFLNWGGLAVTASGLLMAFASMIISPAMPKPLTTRWPEGGEPVESSTAHSSH